jgi:hypothetical protein
MLMPLPQTVISGDTLKKRWNISSAGILFMLMNHDLNTANKLGYDIPAEKAPKFEALSLISEDKHDPLTFMYWLEDVIRLESEYPQLISNDRDIFDISELEQRWRMSDEELFDVIENFGLHPVDPVGIELDSKELFDLINYRKRLTPYDLLYRKSDVDQCEAKYPELKEIAHGKEIPDEVISLMQSAKPEIERLYEALKTVGLGQEYGEPEARWRDAVLKEFKRNESEYNLVRKDLLQNPNLYILNTGQEPRDFKGKLLQLIIENQGLGRFNFQKLHDSYKRLPD